MNINALMQQAQKMQKEMAKQQAALEEKVFSFDSAGGAIHLEMTGKRQVQVLTIDKDAIDPEDKEMLEDMLKIAINEANHAIDAEFDQLNARMSSQMGMGMPRF